MNQYSGFLIEIATGLCHSDGFFEYALFVPCLRSNYPMVHETRFNKDPASGVFHSILLHFFTHDALGFSFYIFFPLDLASIPFFCFWKAP